jgi:hypothetical protein
MGNGLVLLIAVSSRLVDDLLSERGWNVIYVLYHRPDIEQHKDLINTARA